MQALASKGGPLENILLDYYIPTIIHYAFANSKSSMSPTGRRKVILEDEFLLNKDESSYIVCAPSFPIIPLERRINAADPGTIYVKTQFSDSIAKAYDSVGLLQKFSRKGRHIVPVTMEETEALLKAQQEVNFDTDVPKEYQKFHRYCYVNAKHSVYGQVMGQMVKVVGVDGCEVNSYLLDGLGF